MALNAGEVYVVIGAKLATAELAAARAALLGQKKAADEAQASINKAAAAQKAAALEAQASIQKTIDHVKKQNDAYTSAAARGEAASNRLRAANERWTRAAVVGAKASAIGIAGVVTALAGAAVAASNFDASMRNVNSIAGLNEKSFKALEGQILRLSTAVGKGPTELADGLYSIVSSGFKAADAMKILTASARAARAGLTDTSTATTAITAVLNSYGLGANKARMVSDVLFQTVNTGVLNFEQLAGSLGKVLSPAASIGVSLKDLSGALAALTLRGNSADEAATQLGQTMVTLQKPGPALAKLLKGIGYESGTAAIKAVGFKGTLDQIAAAAKKSGIPLADLFGNVRALRGVQGLEGTAHAAAVFTSSVKDMDEATKGAGATQKVYLEQQKSTAAMFDHLKAVVNVAAITIGSALLPQINAGITAMTHWFAEAQKSGDIQRWASEIAHGVSEVVTFLHSLGPEASAAFHVVASTVQAAIPFVEALYKAFETLEPAIDGVAHASAGLASALGPAPILAAAAAYLALRRATLTAQAGVGTFSKVMLAGQKAIGTSGGGIELAAGKYNRVGAEAIKASSFAKTAARGIAASFGPQLLAVGAAGIVASIIYIKSTMTDLKKETQDVVDAIAELQGTRLDVAAAKIAQARAHAAVPVAEKTLGSRAVDVENAQAASLATREPGGHPNLPDPKVVAAIRARTKAWLDVKDARNAAERADAVASAAEGARQDAAAKLARQLVGQGQKALEEANKPSFKIAGTGGRYGSDNTSDAGKAKAYQVAVDNLVHSINTMTDANNKLDKSGKAVGHSIADFIKTANRIPTKAEYTIIADDKAAGKSNAKILKDLGWIGKQHPTPTIGANTKPFDDKYDDVGRKAAAIDALRPKVHLGTSGFNAVQSAIDGINRNILHLTANPFTVKVNYATNGALPNPTSIDRKKHGSGTKTDGPEIALIGEGAAPEYLIPTESKYKARGISLWMQAGRDLGIPGYKAGVKKPGKTPPPIKRGLGYDPQALDDQKGVEEKRLQDARDYRDKLSTRIKTDTGHQKSLEKQLETSQRQAKSKNHDIANAAKKRVVTLTTELNETKKKIEDERAARKHQINDVIPRDVRRYGAATKAATIGKDHADKITLWQDRADAQTSAMTTASAQWDAADRKKDPAGKKKAYDAWVAAQRGRGDALQHVKTLLDEVKKVVGATDYGARITGDLATAIGNIVQAQDDTQAPGYEAPEDVQPPSTDLADYLTADEVAYQQQQALDTANAALTDDKADDVQAAREAVHIAGEIRDRLTAAGAPIGLITQAAQDLASANSDLANAVQAGSPDAAGTPQITADQQAALDQQTAKATAAQANADSAAAALKTFQASGDLFRGGSTVNVNVQTLTPGSPAMQRQIGEQVTGALGGQPSIPRSRGFYDG